MLNISSKNRIYRSIVIKIFICQFNWFFYGTLQLSVCSEIPDYQVYIAVMIKISCCNFVPESSLRNIKPGFGFFPEFFPMIINEYTNRHKLTNDNQIGPGIFIQIDPDSISDHPTCCQIGKK